MVYWCTIYR